MVAHTVVRGSGVHGQPETPGEFLSERPGEWEIIQYHFRLQGAPQDTGYWALSLGLPFFPGGTHL